MGGVGCATVSGQLTKLYTRKVHCRLLMEPQCESLYLNLVATAWDRDHACKRECLSKFCAKLCLLTSHEGLWRRCVYVRTVDVLVLETKKCHVRSSHVLCHSCLVKSGCGIRSGGARGPRWCWGSTLELQILLTAFPTLVCGAMLMSYVLLLAFLSVVKLKCTMSTLTTILK